MTKSVFSQAYEHFRELLIQARKHAGLTQTEVAIRLSRPQSYVSKYECGERRLDVIEFLEVAQVLDLDVMQCILELQRDLQRNGDGNTVR
jgi:transcriptional regulator with XRE-family HTH domain